MNRIFTKWFQILSILLILSSAPQAAMNRIFTKWFQILSILLILSSAPQAAAFAFFFFEADPGVNDERERNHAIRHKDAEIFA